MIHLLLPSRCLLCHATLQNAHNLCESCEADLPKTLHRCLQCGEKLFSERFIHTLCGRCLKTPPPYDRIIAPFFYHPPISRLITDLKFHYKLSRAQLLSHLLAKHLKNFYHERPLPEGIIPMPLHRSRIRTRGYNQALELSRTLSKIFSLPLQLHAVERIRATQAQSLLSAHARVKNVKHAFQVKKNWRMNHIAIVDDVITTGSTCAELCRVLREAGVTIIDVWCPAKAPTTARHVK